MIPISKPQIGPEEQRAVAEVLASGYIVQGPRTAAFEEAFARMVGVKHAVAISSGTAALHVALLAHEVGPGDEVITSAFTFIASANSVLFTGARPVFADIDAESFNLSPAAVESAITPRTKAIMPVHLYGNPAEMDALLELADQHGLAVIEDAAQAHGAAIGDRMCGSFGTGCFSLYATKNMTTAEGGMITTDDDSLAEKCRLLRSHGMPRRYHHDSLGFNFRMTDINAAIGLVQLEKLPAANARRAANARFLSQNLAGVTTPKERPGTTHAWHQYTVRVRDGTDRDAAVEAVREAGVGVAIFYPVPVHHQKLYRELGYDVSLPVTERLSREVFSLPVHPSLTPDDLETIVAAVNPL
jgi:dTDP-4-amino-4,6-dideoxygalactose transaminase